MKNNMFGPRELSCTSSLGKLKRSTFDSTISLESTEHETKSNSFVKTSKTLNKHKNPIKPYQKVKPAKAPRPASHKSPCKAVVVHLNLGPKLERSP